MSQIEKLEKKLRRHPTPSGIRFKEVKKLLEYYGFNMRSPSGGGSHYIFHHPALEDSPWFKYGHITIAKHSEIKKVYIRETIKAIDVVKDSLS